MAWILHHHITVKQPIFFKESSDALISLTVGLYSAVPKTKGPGVTITWALKTK